MSKQSKDLNTKFLSDKQLSDRYEVHRATIWRWSRDGFFPQPVKFGNHCTRWKLSDVEAWEAAQEVPA
ncbi:helix-turn-helix transcriptional regulator [Marinobacter koreensis]|uniref:Helix-turn-helix transcriptional regulator n=1 Tax=Marinobacter koreensis TaxID=335974 RepID=A0ABW0RJ05_9GAMM|nr:AlpA family phage regulatory protein [Marinobacter koreensis]MCK7548487.1 AlpA family phage regulatory protein [Marinobacter koreensis]